MSSTQTQTRRRDIQERTTSLIVRQRHTGTALAGAGFTSALVGPAVGKRWEITHVAVGVTFVGAPGAGDEGFAYGQVFNGGVPHTLHGVEVLTADGQVDRNRGLGTYLLLENGDTMRINVDAVNSGVNVTGFFEAWGIEYDELP